MREIRDAAGVEWMVYAVNPITNQWAALHSLPEGYRGGWLCFESPNEKRRLTYPPPDWETLSTEALTRLLGDAVQVRRHKEPRVASGESRVVGRE